MKTFVIVDHRAKEVGNQLLSDLSVHAAALATGARVVPLFRLVRMGRLAYMGLARIIDACTRRKNNLWALGAPYFLPPSGEFPARVSGSHAIFFFGWMFRNPEGLRQYRTELVEAFSPRGRAAEAIAKRLAEVEGKVLIGVHMRLEPFRGFSDGEFLVEPHRVRAILDEYCAQHGLQKEKVALIVVTDRALPKEIFSGFTLIEAVGNTAEHLHLLSKGSVIIGTNTTFAHVAAWFGNVPHVVTVNESVDWPYYQGEKNYFENKYANFAL